MSEEKTFDRLVLQGDTWGPSMAANQVDTLGKQLLVEKPDYLYKYKGYVPIGILGMVDDIVGLVKMVFMLQSLMLLSTLKLLRKSYSLGTTSAIHSQLQIKM